MLIDITRTIGFDTLTYPGDDGLKIQTLSSIDEGDSWNISKLSMNYHMGTHLDAPLHRFKNGKDLNRFKINDFIFDCDVIQIKSDFSVSIDEIKNYSIKPNQAILFKTKNSNLKRKSFNNRFVSIEKEVAEYLENKKVKLVGIDYLSVDALDSPDFPVHNILLKKNILILEDVYLKNIKPGKYKLSCFPIKIYKANGAPCRAFLETVE